MRKNRSIEIKVGVVSILAIVLFFLGMFLGKDFTVSQSYKLKMRFPNSGGIQPSSPIVVNGVQRGSVTSIANDNGSVIILAEIKDISDLKKDVSAQITILELTGGKKIELNPGFLSEKFDPNNEIPGITPTDLAGLIVMLGNVSQDAVSLIRRLDTISVSVTNVINDRETIGEIKDIITNTKDITQNLSSLLAQNNVQLRETLNNLHSITKDMKTIIDKNDPRLDTLMTNVNYSLEKTRNLVLKVDTALDNANSILSDVNDITGEVKNGRGIANRLIYDKELAIKLEKSLDSITVFIEQLKQHGINTNIRLGTRP